MSPAVPLFNIRTLQFSTTHSEIKIKWVHTDLSHNFQSKLKTFFNLKTYDLLFKTVKVDLTACMWQEATSMAAKSNAEVPKTTVLCLQPGTKDGFGLYS